MKIKTILLFFAILTAFSGLVVGQESISFDSAKALSEEQGKPILMEFVRED